MTDDHQPAAAGGVAGSLPAYAPYAAIFGLALVVRSIYLLEWTGTPLWDVLLGDGGGYDEWARSIAAGDWFGDDAFYQAPFYPYLMGILYRVTGPAPGAVRLLQIVLGSAACVGIALAGRRFFSERTGWWAGAGLALYAPAVYYDGLVQKPAIGGVLMISSLLLLGTFEARRRAVWIVAAGLALAAYALTRENALLLLPIVGVWLAVRFSDESASLRGRWVAALLLGAALLLVPVGLRNLSAGGGLQLTTAQFGPNLYIGNHQGATGRYVPLRPGRGSWRYERIDATQIAEADAGRPLSAGEVSSYWTDRALDYMTTSPGAWLRLVLHKAWLVWRAPELMDTHAFGMYADESWLLRVLGWFLHFGVLFPLAVFGAWATRSERGRLWLLWAIALAMAAGPVLFYVNGRYRYAVVPVAMLFASAGALELARRVRGRDWRAAGAAAAIVAVAALVSNWPLRLYPEPRAVGYYSLGLALKQHARLDDAHRAMQTAERLWPTSPDVHLQMGSLLLSLRQPEVAAPHFERSLALSPGQANAHAGLGLALHARGEFAGAMGQYARAIEIDPKHGDANNNFANGLAQQQRWDQAIEHYRVAAEAIPNRAEVHLNLGHALLQSGKPEQARVAYRRAQAVSPALPTARYAEALALDSLDRRGAAAQIFAELLRQPSAPQWTFSPDVMSRLAEYLATCREPELRDPEEALKLAETARRLHAPEFRALLALAAARAASGDFEGAVDSSDAALQLSERVAVHPDLVELASQRREAYANGLAVSRECRG